MVLNFEGVPVGTKSMAIGGGVEDWDKRDDVWVVDCDKFIGSLFFP